MPKRTFKHWTNAYIVNRLKLMVNEIKNPDLPWLTQEAVSILSSLVRQEDVGVEWGSGRSTVWFGKRMKRLISVEHDLMWFHKVSKELFEQKVKNVVYSYKPVKKEYMEVASRFGKNTIDFALVDGIWRDSCALHVIEKIKVGGLLVIDNVNWYLPSASISPNSRTAAMGPATKRWSVFNRMTENWRRIWTTNGVTDTAIYIKQG